MNFNAFKPAGFNILKPQPSPKSLRTPLTDITNFIGVSSSKSLQTKNQNKAINTHNKIINTHIKINQQALKNLCQYQKSQNQLNSYKQIRKKFQSLKPKNIKMQINQQLDSYGHTQKKKQLRKVKRIQSNQIQIQNNQIQIQTNQIQIQKQSKMLKQIRQFLHNASETSKIIKQREKYKENQKSYQLYLNNKKIQEIKQERDQILQQVKQKYQKQLINLQSQIESKTYQITKQITHLKQANFQLQQILTDIQNNICNLNSFDEEQFRCIMDHYWTKVNLLQVSSQKNLNKYKTSISPTKKKINLRNNFTLVSDKNLKTKEMSIIQNNIQESINFSDALKKAKSKTKLELFSQQLKRAITDLQKQAKTKNDFNDKIQEKTNIQSEEETSRFNDSIIEISPKDKDNLNKQKFTYQKIKPNLNEQNFAQKLQKGTITQYTFKKPSLSFQLKLTQQYTNKQQQM